MKILTEIMSPAGMVKRKLIVQNSKIIVKKGRRGRGRPDYCAEFTPRSLIPYRAGMWPFKHLSQKLILIEGADKCLEFYYSALDQNNYVDEQLDKVKADKTLNEEQREDRIAKLEDAKVLMPVWDRDAQDKNAEATVVKNAGTISNKIEVPGLLYIAIFLSTALSFLTILVVSGRLRI